MQMFVDTRCPAGNFHWNERDATLEPVYLNTSIIVAIACVSSAKGGGFTLVLGGHSLHYPTKANKGQSMLHLSSAE